MTLLTKDKNSLTVQNLNDYLNHQLNRDSDSAEPSLVSLSYSDAPSYRRKPNWFYDKIGWGERVEKQANIALSVDEFPEDLSLIKSGLFDSPSDQNTINYDDYYDLLEDADHNFERFYPKERTYKLEKSQEVLNHLKTRITIAPGIKEEDDKALQACLTRVKAAETNMQAVKEKRLQLLSSGPNSTRFLPLIYQATGFLPQIAVYDNPNEKVGICHEMDIRMFEALVPFHDPMREKQVSLNKKIVMLRKYAERVFCTSNAETVPISKYNALSNLAYTLSELTQDFFRDYNQYNLRSNTAALTDRYTQFKVDFQHAVNENKEIDVHRGYLRLTVQAALTLAAGLGIVTAAIDYGCQAFTGSPAFAGKTSSRLKVEEVRHLIDTSVEDVISNNDIAAP